MSLGADTVSPERGHGPLQGSRLRHEADRDGPAPPTPLVPQGHLASEPSRESHPSLVQGCQSHHSYPNGF
eukprot:4127178-Prorocentrum_lima.AAC.1